MMFFFNCLNIFATEMVVSSCLPLQYNAIFIRRCSITIYYWLNWILINLSALINKWGISSAHSVVASHAGDPSSIPGKDDLFFFFLYSVYAFNILKHRILNKFAFSTGFWHKKTMLKKSSGYCLTLAKIAWKSVTPLGAPYSACEIFSQNWQHICDFPWTQEY